MSLSFYGVDEEFAASTGDNVRVTPTSSNFDYPPNSFTNLIITANPDDPDPRLFEIGDAYDLQARKLAGMFVENFRPFAAAGVPAIHFLTRGTSGGGHSIYDTADKVPFHVYENLFKLIVETVEELGKQELQSQQ